MNKQMEELKDVETFDAEVEVHGGEPYAVWAPALNGSHVKTETYYALLADLESAEQRIAELEQAIRHIHGAALDITVPRTAIAKAAWLSVEHAAGFKVEGDV